MDESLAPKDEESREIPISSRVGRKRVRLGQGLREQIVSRLRLDIASSSSLIAVNLTKTTIPGVSISSRTMAVPPDSKFLPVGCFRSVNNFKLQSPHICKS